MVNIVPQSLQDGIAKLSACYKAEKEEFHTTLQHMNETIKTLEAEMQSLQDLVNMATATDDEKTMMLKPQKEQNSISREKVAGQQYLHGVAEEKKP